jgi:hypothetical protein
MDIDTAVTKEFVFQHPLTFQLTQEINAYIRDVNATDPAFFSRICFSVNHTAIIKDHSSKRTGNLLR